METMSNESGNSASAMSTADAATPQQVNFTLGTPLGATPTRVLLLGSGELGKEIAIELMRLGAWVCACDSYAGAPAMHVAHECRVFDMTDPARLDAAISEIKPTIIVPEVEAIATQELSKAAAAGVEVVPSCEVAAICMNRERLRVLAHETLGLPTTPYRFADSLDELKAGAEEVGYPCVVKPIMSSSGHGQSVVRDPAKIEDAWHEAQVGRRAAAGHENQVSRVIVEALAPLDYELTVLTVSSSAGVVTCRPVGHVQVDGDYRESWQPAAVPDAILDQAQSYARRMVTGLTDIAHRNGEKGWGVFGVEIFVLKDGTVLFNEVSPRPHDTGMVTMISQRLSEFALHARAVLGIPVTESDVSLLRDGKVCASRAIVVEGTGQVEFSDLPDALSVNDTDVRLFGKPGVNGGHRRMGVVLAVDDDAAAARARTQTVLDRLTITVNDVSAPAD